MYAFNQPRTPVMGLGTECRTRKGHRGARDGNNVRVVVWIGPKKIAGYYLCLFSVTLAKMAAGRAIRRMVGLLFGGSSARLK